MLPIQEINAYVICLEKKREKRCDANFASIQKIFPLAEWTSAVDANTISHEDDNRISVYAKYHIKTKLDTDISHLASKGAIGCSLSHIGLWKRIVEENKPAIIIEDDMHFSDKKADSIREAYRTLPTDTNYASIVHLPWPASNIIISNKSYEKISSRDMLAGTQMYFITPRGAEILLREAFPIVTHIDVYISYMSSVYPEELNGTFYTKPLYSFFEFIRDDMTSTIKHKSYIKKMLPESNTFYLCTFVFIFMLITTIVLLFTRMKKR